MNGLYLIKPTSIASTGTSATINTNGSVSFTAVSSLSLNGVFSADYDNYMIVVRNTGGAVGWQQLLRLRSSGTDDTGNNYTWQALYARSTTVGAGRTTSTNYWERFSIGGPHTGFIAYVYGPYLAQPTAARTIAHENTSGYTDPGIFDSANTHALSSSYDGFTWTQSNSGAGSPTGLIAVYGMVK